MTTSPAPAESTGDRPGSPVSWMLWSGTWDLFGDLDARREAAVEGPYEWLSLSALDVAAAAASGTSAVELGDRLHSAGLQVVFDPLMGWHDVVADGESPFAAVGLEEALEAARQVGAELISVVAQPHAGLDVDGLAAAFGGVCDRAADFGALAQLEFMPFSSIPDLRTACRVLETADRPNAGLLLDSWHFFRSDPDFALLGSLDGSRVFSVQLNDGVLRDTPGTRAETMDRALPGEGQFDLARFLRVLADVGGLRRVGAEVITPAHREMSARAAVTRSQAALESVMRAAGVLD